MIEHPAFTVEPWCAAGEPRWTSMLLAQTESVFALSNGHIGCAATSTRASRTACPGTYLNGVYELRPLPYAEAGYGYPGVRADGHQRDQRQADPAAGRRRALRRPLRELRAHERVLDFRAGVLRRTRRVGLAGRAHGAGHLDPAGVAHPARDRRDRYEVEALDGPARIVVQSELVANEHAAAVRR